MPEMYKKVLGHNALSSDGLDLRGNRCGAGAVQHQRERSSALERHSKHKLGRGGIPVNRRG